MVRKRLDGKDDMRYKGASRFGEPMTTSDYIILFSGGFIVFGTPFFWVFHFFGDIPWKINPAYLLFIFVSESFSMFNFILSTISFGCFFYGVYLGLTDDDFDFELVDDKIVKKKKIISLERFLLYAFAFLIISVYVVTYSIKWYFYS